MRIERYGIVLESLEHDHLEMVRLWRNQDFVRSNMQFQAVLSRADQEKWFDALDQDKNLYWVIRYNDYPIGLIHIKNIDFASKQGEAGIFIGEPSYLEMPQPMLAILLMMEIAFSVLKLNTLLAKIKSGNFHAINFNLKLGYQFVPNQPEGFQYYRVSKERFQTVTEKLRSSSGKMFGKHTHVIVSNRDQGLQATLATIIHNCHPEWLNVSP